MRPITAERRPVRPADWDPPPAALDPAAVAAAMERIRAHVHRWLDRLEELAAEAAPLDRDAERQRAALREEVERHQREWESQVAALDHDRRLLAEAWERLEHAQLAALAMPGTAGGPPRPGRPPTAPPPIASRAAPAPPPAPAPPTEPGDDIDRAILRQFEALRRDVRRAAESRGTPAP